MSDLRRRALPKKRAILYAFFLRIWFLVVGRQVAYVEVAASGVATQFTRSKVSFRLVSTWEFWTWSSLVIPT